MAHLPALVALTAPTVNSYRRLQPRFWSSAYTAWGPDNREGAIRIPSKRRGREEESTNLELKPSDPSCNPYLALGGLLAAGLDGIERKLDPGAPTLVDPDTLSDAERAQRGIRRLPRSLGEALDALERDEVLREALGEVLAREYLAVKRSEVRAFDGKGVRLRGRAALLQVLRRRSARSRHDCRASPRVRRGYPGRRGERGRPEPHASQSRLTRPRAERFRTRAPPTVTSTVSRARKPCWPMTWCASSMLSTSPASSGVASSGPSDGALAQLETDSMADPGTAEIRQALLAHGANAQPRRPRSRRGPARRRPPPPRERPGPRRGQRLAPRWARRGRPFGRRGRRSLGRRSRRPAGPVPRAGGHDRSATPRRGPSGPPS